MGVAHDARYSEKFASLRDSFRNDFKEVGAVAMEGLNKNWWNEQPHPLKEALYASMAERGVRGKIDIIEAAFADAGADFLDRVVDCTYRLMDMEPEAYSQVATHIAGSNVIGIGDDRAIDEIPESGDSYSKKLAAGNVPLQGVASQGTLLQDRARRAFEHLGKRAKGTV